MALTGMQIYKLLPRTNCKDCGFPTCMAFAMQVAAKQKALTDCPHISQDSLESMSEASAPPMKLIKIGAGDKSFEIGQETVMFRHEEKFHRPAGIAVRVPATVCDDEAGKLIEKINGAQFERVGATLKVALCAVEVDGSSDPAGRAKLAAEKSKVPLMIVGTDAEKIKAAVEAVKDQRPLIYRADPSNVDAMAALAASAKVPLAVTASSLEELADTSEKARSAGAEDLVLAFREEKIGEVVRKLTVTRRAALRQKFKPFGFPSMVEVVADSAEATAALGAVAAAKYAGIVLIDGVEPWEVLPIMVTVQGVYTDPQVPNTVEAKLYEIGNVTDNSPVMFTTNFSLTYFSVAGEVERSKVPCYISVVDTEGLGVLNAWAGDKVSAEKVVKALQDQKVADKVKHRKLIIPGLLPMFRAEIEDISEWSEVIIGPENSREIPAFLTSMRK
jgi:acetyl-CoA decarbonylase/synthase complex subunit gamma